MPYANDVEKYRQILIKEIYAERDELEISLNNLLNNIDNTIKNIKDKKISITELENILEMLADNQQQTFNFVFKKIKK